MANCYLGKPLAFAYRVGVNSVIPVEFDALLPALTSGYVTVQSVPAGYMLRPAAAADKGARKLSNRHLVLQGREGVKLLGLMTDAMAVVTTVGVLLTCKDRLPKDWNVGSITEIIPGRFQCGRLTRGTRLMPVGPGGLRFPVAWAEELGLNVRAPLYLVRRRLSSGAVQFVLTTRKEGKLVGQWDGDTFQLGWKHLGHLKDGHSVLVRGITGLGWVLRSSHRSQLLEAPQLGGMPNLQKETVFGKRFGRVAFQRGSIPFCDVPQPIIRKAGFEIGDRIAVTRLPGGGVKLTRSEAGVQCIRSRREYEVISFRLGVKDLAWCGAAFASQLQFIACKGAIYVLRSEVANDIPLLLPPVITRVKEIALQDEKLVAVPHELVASTSFKPGDRFCVKVRTNKTSIHKDASGPWTIAANEDGVAEIKLPRELLYQVESNRLRIRRTTLDSLMFEDARQTA